MTALCSLLLLFCAHAAAPVRVTVHESVAPKATTYSYRVINRTKQPITALRIGYDPSRQEPQLITLPLGWTFERGLAPDTATAPAGWTARLVTTEENRKFMLEWTNERGTKSDIAPGTSEDRFRVIVPHAAREYLQSMFEVVLSDSTHLHGPLQSTP